MGNPYRESKSAVLGHIGVLCPYWLDMVICFPENVYRAFHTTLSHIVCMDMTLPKVGEFCKRGQWEITRRFETITNIFQSFADNYRILTRLTKFNRRDVIWKNWLN